MLEASPQTGAFCHGDSPTLADAFLSPQVYNAARFDCDLSAFPNVMRIDAACQELDAFRAAHPDNQPDNE
jgi:maleylpyruvate isomerase